MSSRARFGLAGLILGVLIAALGPGGSARAAEIGTTPAEKCNPTGRTICLTVKTFENITASDPARPDDGQRFTWVEWTLRNGGGTTLTNPVVTVSFADLCGAGLADCSGASTAQFVLPASPNVCSVQGGNLVCTYPNLAAGASAATTQVYFKTADKTATRDVRATRINVTATAKERANDGNQCGAGDPNCDTFTSSIVNSYEPDADASVTFGLNGKRFNLPTNDGLSSFTFTAPSGSPPFLTSFTKLATADATALCFSTVECFDRPLSVNSGGVLSSGLSTPVLFYSRLFNTNIPEKQLNAIHFYDAVPLTLLAGNRLTPGSTPSFARMDGLRLTATAFGLAPDKYYVVNYQAANNSFQLSLSKGGAPLPLTAGTGSGEPIRIIGDDTDGSERSSAVCSTNIPPPSVTMPKICAKKVAPQTLDAFLWDLGNGNVNW